MSNGSDKFNMFEDIEDSKVQRILHSEDETNDDEVEIVSITMKTDTKKKYSTAVVRSQEDYDLLVQSTYFETHYHPETNEPYEVKVQVLQPEVNPMELMRPAYAYSSNH